VKFLIRSMTYSKFAAYVSSLDPTIILSTLFSDICSSYITHREKDEVSQI
jgi:hypothetical protein